MIGSGSFSREGEAPRPAPVARVKVRMTKDHLIDCPGFFRAFEKAGSIVELPQPAAEQVISLGVAERV